MNKLASTKNPLKHHGTSQYERLLQALMPTYFKIDGRSVKELLHVTYQFAGLVKYYNEENHEQGDWQSFWKVEMLTFLAYVSTIDIDKITSDYQAIKTQFKQDMAEPANCGEDRDKTYHIQLIEYIFQLAFRIEEIILYLPHSLPLRQEIIGLVAKDSLTDTDQLASSLKTLIGFHKEAHFRLFEKRLESSKYHPFFKDYWGVPNRDVFDNQIDHSALYLERGQEDIDSLFKVFYQALKKIKAKANYYFDKNLATPQLRQPHVALFLAFLQLFDHARNSLNDLTRKHLDYYFEKVLCIQKRDAVPDDTHLLLELASTVDRVLVEKGTTFIGGKDKEGKLLLYKTMEDWSLNHAKVTALKTTYLDINGVLRDGNGEPIKEVKAANDVKAFYESKEILPNQEYDYWRTMGDNTDLPQALIGFAIASPQLILREGRRRLSINLQLNADLREIISSEEIDNNPIVVELSTEKEWLRIKQSDKIVRGNLGDAGELFSEPTFIGKVIEGGTILAFDIILEKDHPSIEQLGEVLQASTGFTTPWPIIKIGFVGLDADALLRVANVKLESFSINVDVKDIQENLIVQSDQGLFNGTQKFYPFGSLPEVGDQFYIGSTEVFQKNINTLEFEFEWIDPPVSYSEHYSSYIIGDDRFFVPQLRLDYLDKAELPQRVRAKLPPTYVGPRSSDSSEFQKVEGIVLDKNGSPLLGVNLILKGTTIGTVTDVNGTYSLAFNNPLSDVIVASFIGYSPKEIPINGFRIVNIILNVEEDTGSNVSYFPLIEDDQFQNDFTVLNVPLERDARLQEFTEYSPAMNRGFVRFTLASQDFYHKAYPNLLAIRSIEKASSPQDPDIQLPNAPYTPATNGIRLSYTSWQSVQIGEQNDGIDDYFHLYPFGGFANIAIDQKLGVEIMPTYELPTFESTPTTTEIANGNLYIGVENLNPGANLSLLFQIQEGSEAEPDVNAPEIHWSYLGENNAWKPLSITKILKDTTNGLQKTGIVQIATPRDMVMETTLFKENGHWLRAAVVENPANGQFAAGLPSIVDVKAQVVLVTFEDNNNELSHLEKPLPAMSISKLLISQAGIKGIEQPFDSMNGRLPEKGKEFYIRVSERLRHKDRALCIYDHERLLLDKFPDIQRAKCLSHTKPGFINLIENTFSPDQELAPGFVTMAVIPSLAQRKGGAAAKPRFSKGILNDMATYLRKKTNLFVAGSTPILNITDKPTPYLSVVNPLYEEIRLSFNVQFKRGEDELARMFDLDKALKRNLAPWLFDANYPIKFSRTLSRSKIILFIEQQPYVEALSNLVIYHEGVQIENTEISPSSSRSILTTVNTDQDNPATTDHDIRVEKFCETA